MTPVARRLHAVGRGLHPRAERSTCQLAHSSAGVENQCAESRLAELGATHRSATPGWAPLVYLASGMGFSAQERAGSLPALVAALQAVGCRVFEPFTMNGENANAKQEQPPGWAYRIGQADMQAVRDCDAVFCCANMNPPDEGAMIELGAAIALHKKTFIFRDDFRSCAGAEDFPLNLMIFTGLPQEGWRDYYYTDITQIGDRHKALARWVAGENV